MTNTSNFQIRQLADGSIVFWVVESSSLHIKAITAYGDPVELNAQELREFIVLLEAALIEIE
jgi:hypothetical protein